MNTLHQYNTHMNSNSKYTVIKKPSQRTKNVSI